MEFRSGGLYFMIWYVDEDRLYLAPDALVYLGRNLEADRGDAWYFQDAASYCERGPRTDLGDLENTVGVRDEEGPKASVYRLRAHELDQIVDCSGLARHAMECAVRWKDAAAERE